MSNLPDEFKKKGVDLTPRTPKKDPLDTIFTIAVVSLLLVVLFMAAGCVKRDSSDNPVTGEWSGMGIHVDHLTGCHYLSVYKAGLVPRMNADGTQVCTGVEQ